MSEHDDSIRRSLSESGRARRRFLESTALAAVGTSASVLVSAQSSSSAPSAAPANCPSVPTPMREVEGKVAFITGGSSGIGLGIARAFTDAGMKVVITYRTKSNLDEAMKYLASAGNRVHAINLDVTDRAAMEKAAEETVRVFGKVHVLVNNAGVGVAGPLSTATYDDWDWGIGVNLNGVFNGIHTILPRIIRHGEGGHVVTVSSMSGMFAGSTTGVYTTSKFAVVGMMEALRTEMFAEGLPIGVSVYVPGGVNSNIRDTERNRPPELRNPGSQQQQQQLTPEQRARLAELASRPGPGMDPLEAGEYVLRGIQNNDLYIISHPEYASGIEERHEAIMASVPEAPPAPPERVAYERVVLTNVIYPTERDRKRAQKRGLIS